MHGDRAKRKANKGNRDYWSRRYGNDSQCNSMPCSGHHVPRSAKRITSRAERRKSRQENHDA